MEALSAGVSHPFEVTYAPALYVGMVILDYSSGSPVQVTGLSGMVNGVLPMLPDSVGSSLYVAVFSPGLGKQYTLKKNVYTDNTYTEIDSSGNYAQGSESFEGVSFGITQVFATPIIAMVGCSDQPRQHPVVVAQNSDMNLLISFLDEDQDPLNCLGATAVELLILESDNETVLQKSIADGHIVAVEGTINQFLVTMMAADFALLPPGEQDVQVLLSVGGANYAFNLYDALRVDPAAV